MKKRPKSHVRQEVGRAAAMPVSSGGNPLTFIGSSLREIQANYEALEDDDAREAFFDDIVVGMERNAPRAWSRVYSALDLCRREKWYWQGKGYKTFADFLTAELKFPFEQFAILEKRYLFASRCCPDLFQLKAKDIDQLMEAWAKVPAAKHRGRPQKGVTQNGSHLKTRQDRERELDYESQSEDFQRGYQSRGSGNRIYRFRKLKRDAPKIAQAILNGEYMTPDGGDIDLKRAEEDAARRYPKYSPPPQRNSRAKPLLDKAKEAVSKLTDAEWNQLVEWMNKQ